MPSSHLILCRPLLLLPLIPPSIRVFPNESTPHMTWPRYWSSSFSIISPKEIPGLISFRMDWLDLLAVQGTLQSLLQHHSSKASILWHSASFTVQLSHPERSYPMPQRPRPGAVVGRSNPTPEARGGSQEDQPHVQGAMAARAQEGLEELSHVKGQEGRR